MRKILIGIVGLIIVVAIGAYILLFTQFGNNLLKPTIQKKISKALGKSIVVEKFKLRPSTLKLVCTIKNKKFLDIHGKLNLFSKSMDLNYSVDIPNIGDFTGKKSIKGSFYTTGRVYGEFSDFFVNGDAKAFGGLISYKVRMVKDKPSSLLLSGNDLRLEQALAMFNLPIYADGSISVKAKFNKLMSEEGNGSAVLKISKG